MKKKVPKARAEAVMNYLFTMLRKTPGFAGVGLVKAQKSEGYAVSIRFQPGSELPSIPKNYKGVEIYTEERVVAAALSAGTQTKEN